MNQSRRFKVKSDAAIPVLLVLLLNRLFAVLFSVGMFAGSLLSLSLFAVTVIAAESEKQVLITDVIVNRSNIFDASAVNSQNPQDPRRLLALGVNRFHKVTLESVILRTIGISAGDTIPVAEVEEAERRLRDLGIFASVEAALVTGDEGVELHISTRDNFSLVAGITGSFLGGVGNIGFIAGERNVFGTGNRLQFGLSRSSTNGFRGSLSFTDLHFFDKQWQAEYSVGRTTDGNFASVELGDRFRSLSDSHEWSVTLDYIEDLRDYYLDGSVVFQLPEDRSRLIAEQVWRTGTSEQFIRKGLEARFLQSIYSQPSGAFGDLTQQEDRRTLYVGGLLANDRIHSYRKVQGLDTLSFVQDIRLGTIAQIELGINLVDEFNSGEGSRIDPEVSVLLDAALAAGEHSLVRLALTGNAIFEKTGERPWSTTARVRAYNTALKNTTLAFNANYTISEDGSDLPVQLTLGENNGLRGYDSRQFQGQQRLRMNLEGRYNAGWKLGFLDVGIVGFADAGWAAARSDSSPSIRRSIGAGLRLASNSLLGTRVIRIDLALPLDAPESDSANPSLSLAVGQVFSF